MTATADAQIGTREALKTIGRAMRYSLMYKYELAVKATTQMTSIFWILFLPWPAKRCTGLCRLDTWMTTK